MPAAFSGVTPHGIADDDIVGDSTTAFIKMDGTPFTLRRISVKPIILYPGLAFVTENPTSGFPILGLVIPNQVVGNYR